jgi:hypothetical protein
VHRSVRTETAMLAYSADPRVSSRLLEFLDARVIIFAPDTRRLTCSITADRAISMRCRSWSRPGSPSPVGGSRPSGYCRSPVQPGMRVWPWNFRSLVAEQKVLWRKDNGHVRRPAVLVPGENFRIKLEVAWAPCRCWIGVKRSSPRRGPAGERGRRPHCADPACRRNHRNCSATSSPSP